ncbi:ABC transporter [Haloquadratum walsbyi]|jgi:ABC-type uncharacterized transport system.|uniref:ABC-type uncharacterized transport system n=1 Tax=Haloquadratum walsbyi J07HQW2 TaxID=1238425 RepID=U1NFB6_9EURY|nr:ABC transporter [Haloquadratum walsbyi]ERG95488.1 MAG: ABC-type uncharacterized transport system [Haloquadratum walsbyi J07HQW2]
MQVRELTAPAAVFAVIITVVLIGALVIPFIGGGTTPQVTNLAAEQTNTDTVQITPTAEEGDITVDGPGGSKTVLIDKAHSNRLSDEKLSTLTNALVRNGHMVRVLSREQAREPAWNESLRSADALVIANPTQPYNSGQLAGLEKFANAGGRVTLLADPAAISAGGGLLGLSIQESSAQYTGLASSFGFAAQSGYLYNMHNYQNNFKSIYATTPSETRSSLSEGIDRVVLREAVAISTASAEPALNTVDQTVREPTRREATYTVAATTGSVAIVGDTDFMKPKNVYVADNEILLGNLATFLVSGNKRPGAPAAPDATETQATGPIPGGAIPTTPTAPGGSPGPSPEPEPEPEPESTPTPVE